MSDDIKTTIGLDADETAERAKLMLLQAVDQLREMVLDGDITTLVAIGIDGDDITMASTAGIWRPLQILGALETYKDAVVQGSPDLFREADDGDHDEE